MGWDSQASCCTTCPRINSESEVGFRQVGSQPALDPRIVLYFHFQVLEMKRLVIPLSLHLAYVQQILLDVKVKVLLRLRNAQELT